MTHKFSFDEATMHWARVDGPPGFLWKYGLAYAIAAIVFFLIFGLVIGGTMLSFGSFGASGDPEDVAQAFAAIGPVLLLILPLGMLFWVLFEGAAQRRYVRQEGFSIRFGADEKRLFVVGLFWVLTIVALYIGVALAVGLTVGILGSVLGEAVAIVAIPAIIAAAVFMIWVMIRLSPAAAMTIRDQRITFTSAFSASRGRVWIMFFAFLVIGIIALVVSFVMQLLTVGVTGGLASLGSQAGIGAMILSVPLFFLMYAVQAVIQFAFAGVAAKAALSDPNWPGASAIAAETFS